MSCDRPDVSYTASFPEAYDGSNRVRVEVNPPITKCVVPKGKHHELFAAVPAMPGGSSQAMPPYQQALREGMAANKELIERERAKQQEMLNLRRRRHALIASMM
jgi:hypothetical protein